MGQPNGEEILLPEKLLERRRGDKRNIGGVLVFGWHGEKIKKRFCNHSGQAPEKVLPSDGQLLADDFRFVGPYIGPLDTQASKEHEPNIGCILAPFSNELNILSCILVFVYISLDVPTPQLSPNDDFVHSMFEATASR